MDTRIKLKVLGLTYSQVQKGAYALVLAEENGPRRIPVVIGVSEAIFGRYCSASSDYS